MASDQQFCLRWNNHQNTLVSIFDSLLESGTLVDCTLAAEGRFLQAHKVVLSACSPYFAMLLREHYDKFPILILKDIKYQELQAMMNYMYRGEVNITQETLGSFLKAAESLQIRGLTDSGNCVENNNGVVRDSATHPYHMKKIPESRKIVVPTTPLLSQQRPRSPPVMSQSKKYLKSPVVVENHQNSNSKSTECVEINNSSTKRRKLLPPIKSEGLVVTPINPSTSTFNSVDVNSVCEVPSQPQSIPAVEGKANVPSPSVPPKVESPHMDITPVVSNKIPSAVAASATVVTPEPLIKPKPLSELIKVKSEQLDDSYNEDTNDDNSYTTEDNCENDRDENSQLVGSMNFHNSQPGTNFENITDRTVTSQEGSNHLQESPAFAFNQYWLNNWEYNSKYVRLTETNPFSCQHCGKRYRWKSTLKRHESFECGGKEPAHKCPHCDYRAKQSGNLRVHIRKYHTDRVNLASSVASSPLAVVGDLLPAASSGFTKEAAEEEPDVQIIPCRRTELVFETDKDASTQPTPAEARRLKSAVVCKIIGCCSDSADSDNSKHYSKKRFTPFQVETLKRVFEESPYITQSQAATIARQTGLKKLQVRKWFSDYRCKIKKLSISLERHSSCDVFDRAGTDVESQSPFELVDGEPATENEEDAAPSENEEGEAAATEIENESEAEDEEEASPRSLRPLTVVFGKRGRKRVKKRDPEAGTKRTKKTTASERGKPHTVKRFSPFQVEMLKKAYQDSPYITQRQAAVIARQIGLKKMQVRKWFCDYRCKIKKQSLRMQSQSADEAPAKADASVPEKHLLVGLSDDLAEVSNDEEEEAVVEEFVSYETDSDEPHATNGVIDEKRFGQRSSARLQKRTFRFNDQQLKVLNEEFENAQFLTEEKLTFLCTLLQEKRERIQTWFKMRRYKLRQSEQKFWQNLIDSS